MTAAATTAVGAASAAAATAATTTTTTATIVVTATHCYGHSGLCGLHYDIHDRCDRDDRYEHLATTAGRYGP